MNIEKMREEFEAWASSDFGLRAGHFAKDDDGEYLNYPTQCYFQVWQASRESLVIELPEQFDIGIAAEHEVLDFLEVVEAVKFAGAKVKPCSSST